MSKTRRYSPDTLMTMQRFFTCVEMLRKLRRIRSMTEFCTLISIPPPHYYAQRKDLHKGYFAVGWLCPLVSHYGVSAEWLLTGNGAMLQK